MYAGSTLSIILCKCRSEFDGESNREDAGDLYIFAQS